MAKRPPKPKAPREVAVPAPELPHVEVPPTFAQVLGQDRALEILSGAVRAGRIHHCWIFHGPAGVGKFSAALAFAALLLDPTTQPTFSGAIEADPDSPTRRLLNAGTHPDLHIIRKELARFHEEKQIRERKQQTIPIEVIRQFMLEPSALASRLRSQAAAGKVFIVDEAELLAGAGQNALLKMLEEPPERTVIILVTASEEHLLPTIRSRAQRVFFAPLPRAAMETWMQRSELDVPADQREWLLEFAAGSPGVLSTAAQSGMHEWRSRLAPMFTAAEKGRYSVELGAAMAELVETWAKAHVDEHENASKEAANKAGADWMVRLVAAHLKAGTRTGDPKALARVDALRESERELDANVNLIFVFEKLAAELAA